MKHFLFSITAFCVLMIAIIYNGKRDSDKIKQIDLESIYVQNVRDSILVTGWYYIVDDENGFKRQLDKTDDFYVIDPKPILVKAHFGSVKIYKTEFQGREELGLSIQMNRKCYGLWADATEKSIGKHLGLIVDNKLVSAPYVNGRIERGISSLNRGCYDRKELEDFRKQIALSTFQPRTSTPGT